MPHFASSQVCVPFHLICSLCDFSNLENGTKCALFRLSLNMYPISPHLKCVCDFSNLKNGTKRAIFRFTLSVHPISSHLKCVCGFPNLENVTNRTPFKLFSLFPSTFFVPPSFSTLLMSKPSHQQ